MAHIGAYKRKTEKTFLPVFASNKASGAAGLYFSLGRGGIPTTPPFRRAPSFLFRYARADTLWNKIILNTINNVKARIIENINFEKFLIGFLVYLLEPCPL